MLVFHLRASAVVDAILDHRYYVPILILQRSVAEHALRQAEQR